ncbi:MAG: dihydroorotase [Candidatus Omnitrophica bacterium]|nr:dihydroorotase [Candidatus Omnitrophota bacterium]
MSRRAILIKEGHLIDPAQGIDEPRDLLIEDGVVKEVKKGIRPNGADLVDAKGKTVSPGFIDLHVHLRSPGQEHKETVLTGSRAAALGGFATVCSMANTDPVVDSATVVDYIRNQSARIGLVRILPFAAVTVGLKGEILTEMGDLKEAGAAGFSDDGVPVMNAGIMRRALEYSRITGLPVVAHCEDKNLAGNGVVNQGRTSTRLGLPGIPSEAETIMIARDLLLAEATGGRLHIAHVSTEAGVALIRSAKAKGIRVTAEVTPHHLVLTEESLGTYDARFKMNPPLRTQKDQEALRAGLEDGTIDAIATDHAPHAVSEKEMELPLAPFGVIGLETALGVLLTKLVHRGNVRLKTVIAALTAGPAAVLGINRGTLRVGSPADVTIFDPQANWAVDRETFASKGINSPFLDWGLKGRVTDLVVDGRIILRNRRFTTNGDHA